MTKDSLAPGKETLAYCTSCKMDLGATIVSMTGDRVAKVECRTCKKTHVFRAPKGITEPTAPKPSARKAAAAAKQVIAFEDEWQKLMDGSASAMRPYSTKASFKIGDKLSHPSFGDGIVNRLIHPNKIEVTFRHELKILMHVGP